MSTDTPCANTADTIDQPATENLLCSWLYMSLCIRGNRVLSELTLNEAAICHLITRSETGSMSASQLCSTTKLLKSQMNRELNSLETRGYIRRDADPHDKRKVLVSLTPEGHACYESEHSRVLRIFDGLEQAMGTEGINQLAAYLAEATVIAENIIQEEF